MRQDVWFANHLVFTSDELAVTWYKYFRGGALQYQMDTGVRLTLPKAGAFGENTISTNEGSLGEKTNFGSKLGGIG